MSACSKQFQWQLAASLMAELRGAFRCGCLDVLVWGHAGPIKTIINTGPIGASPPKHWSVYMGLGSSYLVLKHPSLRPNHDQSRRISRVSIATGLSSHIWCKEITTPKWYPQNGSFKGKSWLTIGFEGTYFSENSKLFNEMCLGYILIPVDIHKHSGYIYNYIYI